MFIYRPAAIFFYEGKQCSKFDPNENSAKCWQKNNFKKFKYTVDLTISMVPPNAVRVPLSLIVSESLISVEI